MNNLLRYGLIGGVLISVLMFGPFWLFGTRPDWMRVSEIFGYSSMLLCMSVTWFAMQREQQRRGSLSYGGALAVGIGVTAVAALLFGVVTWIFCALSGDALPEALMTYYADQVRASGATGDELARRLAEVEQMRPMLENHPLQGALMFATVFIIGAVESLVFALVATRGGARAATA